MLVHIGLSCKLHVSVRWSNTHTHKTYSLHFPEIASAMCVCVCFGHGVPVYRIQDELLNWNYYRFFFVRSFISRSHSLQYWNVNVNAELNSDRKIKFQVIDSIDSIKLYVHRYLYIFRLCNVNRTHYWNKSAVIEYRFAAMPLHQCKIAGASFRWILFRFHMSSWFAHTHTHIVHHNSCTHAYAYLYRYPFVMNYHNVTHRAQFYSCENCRFIT